MTGELITRKSIYGLTTESSGADRIGRHILQRWKIPRDFPEMMKIENVQTHDMIIKSNSELNFHRLQWMWSIS